MDIYKQLPKYPNQILWLGDREFGMHLKHDLRISKNTIVCRTCKMVIEI